MPIKESKEQQKIYSFFQISVYFFVIVDFLVRFKPTIENEYLFKIISRLERIGFIDNPILFKASIIILVGVVAIGTKPKKKLDLNIYKSIVVPTIIGFVLFLGSLFLLYNEETYVGNVLLLVFTLNQIAYLIMSMIGVVLIQYGLDNISKIVKKRNGQDRYNIEQESFEQETRFKENPYYVNIPMLFYWKKKWNKGWININTMRGLLLIGTPGSGKSYSIVNPYIRQVIEKGYSACIYDYKYPELARIAYYKFLEQKSKNLNYNHEFNVISLDDIETSARVNVFFKGSITKLGDAIEDASGIIKALQKGSEDSGATQFFSESAVNFLACIIYFFSQYENGKYSTLPHMLAFMNKSYEEVFTVLFSNKELRSLLNPFESAFNNKAFDQLEGQVGTVKVLLSKLATYETFWVFSGNDINLKISDRNNPSILVLASNPRSKTINSAFYSIIINKMIMLINDKGNLPSAIIADEAPTIYFHKIDSLIAEARSNLVAVLYALQERPQLKTYYNKNVADTLTSVVGNVISGSVRSKETLDWMQSLLGKIKQVQHNVSMPDGSINHSFNEKMDFVIPSSKIANLPSGSVVGVIAKDRGSDNDGYTSGLVHCKVNLDSSAIKKEENNYVEIPKRYAFHNDSNATISFDKYKEFANKLYSDSDLKNSSIEDLYKQYLIENQEEKDSFKRKIIETNFDNIYFEVDKIVKSIMQQQKNKNQTI